MIIKKTEKPTQSPNSDTTGGTGSDGDILNQNGFLNLTSAQIYGTLAGLMVDDCSC